MHDSGGPHRNIVHIKICSPHPLLHPGMGYVNVTAKSAHSIFLRHNLTESGVYYLCNVTEMEGGKKKAVKKGVSARLTANASGLLPDTTYRVDCVAYHSDGVEYCLEANTTVTTRELCTYTIQALAHAIA